MRQLLQNLGNGQTTVVDVPAPGPQCGALLVRTTCSLISAGTERMLLDFGRAGWIGKARQQPEKVRAVLAKIRANGVMETLRAVRSKLAQPIPLGYCQVGRVLDAGHDDGAVRAAFVAGDRVVSNGPHAEIVTVSRNVCAKIPDGVSDEAAAFTPLAAIALEGIHLLAPEPGDRVVVTGLGLIGQLAVRILRAMDCEVLGLDPSPERRALAERSGVRVAAGDPVAASLSWTGGKGVAGVLITASTPSHEVVNQAARSCRRRGRVVLVGVVGLQLNRADFYRHEVSFQVSCSYGTRDGTAEHSAWRNFERVLSWMSRGVLSVDDLITHRYDFADAPAAYGALADRSSLGILLHYERAEAGLLDRTARLSLTTVPRGERSGFALVGAGNFAVRTLLPALARVAAAPPIVTVVSRQGVAAWLGGVMAGADEATTDFERVLRDPAVSAVLLTTRHDIHAEQAVAALLAGKHVWVEKPLALREADIDEIAGTVRTSGRVLMVGFNRRFAPMATALHAALGSGVGPGRIAVTVNAGRIDPDHWSLDPRIGGGRIVGEGCHFVDLLRFLAGSAIVAAECTRRDTDGQDGGAFDLHFANGWRGTIDYRTDLPAHHPKERIEITGEKFHAEIDNWARLTTRGLGGLSQGGLWNRSPDKGHREALAAFIAASRGAPPPMPLEEIIEVSRWSIAMQAMAAVGAVRAAKPFPSLP